MTCNRYPDCFVGTCACDEEHAGRSRTKFVTVIMGLLGWLTVVGLPIVVLVVLFTAGSE